MLDRAHPQVAHGTPSEGVQLREQVFWDAHVPSLEECLREYKAGPDPNTALMLNGGGSLAGKRVLDLGCGSGVTTAWLAQCGAIVTGIDISPHSIARANELADCLGLDVELVVGDFVSWRCEDRRFHAVVGRYVLHHLDLNRSAPVIKRLLVPFGTAAFVETMGLNPVLNLARNHLVGRAGVARYGSDDERPISREDLDQLRRELVEVRLMTAEMTFLRIFDRNVLRHRWRSISRVLACVDELMRKMRLERLSYHQVILARGPELGAQ